MSSVPETIQSEILLSVGDSVRVPYSGNPDLQVPYLHFRKYPIKHGKYVITSIWKHPKAEDASQASSYCYTFRKVKEESVFRSLKFGCGHNLHKDKEECSEEYLSTEFRYNCVDWDNLLRAGIVNSRAYHAEDSRAKEFKEELSNLLERYGATLIINRHYDGPRDDDGYNSIGVKMRNKAEVDLGTFFPT